MYDEYDEYEGSPEVEMIEYVLVRCVAKSHACERDVIATRSDGKAGLALVGPNCVLYAEIFFPDSAPWDFCLN
jgi:hypothetical protein